MIRAKCCRKEAFILNISKVIDVIAIEIRQDLVGRAGRIIKRWLTEKAVVRVLFLFLLVVDGFFVALPDLEALVIEDCTSHLDCVRVGKLAIWWLAFEGQKLIEVFSELTLLRVYRDFLFWVDWFGGFRFRLAVWFGFLVGLVSLDLGHVDEGYVSISFDLNSIWVFNSEDQVAERNFKLVKILPALDFCNEIGKL
jgi:hypothetical protein